jgi:putative hydrolase of the HAD superfamily
MAADRTDAQELEAVSSAQLRAVIFDLWDTIVDWPAEDWQGLKDKLADRMGFEPARFDELWEETYWRRQTSPIRTAFEAMGAEPGAVEELVSLRAEFTRAGLRPRQGVVETLRTLRERGFRLGLISVCSEEVPLLWAETPFNGLFDSTVFSATCGLRKPDPKIYLLACRELEVSPQDALFVGDGANDELAGAEQVGMRAVLIHRPGRKPHWPELHDWPGLRITSIPEVLELV